jgi:hypothetical protein
MNAWIKTATRNLLEKSEEKSDYSKAKDEWSTTEKVEDSLENYEIGEEWPSCELCKHEDLRWQFEIKNELNQNRLMVGSTCIKQFNIKLLTSDQNYLEGELRNTKMDQLIRKKINEAKHNEVLDTLRILWKKDVEFRKQIEGTGKFWKEKGYFSPKMAALVIWRLRKQNMAFNPRSLKISIRKRDYQDQIEEMEEWKRRSILPCLTKVQRESLGI